jgi:hypothetical protein
MNRTLKVLAFFLVAFTCAHAEMVYDVCISPGYFNGTGNSPCHFTETTAAYSGGTITLDLGVLLRYKGPVTPNPANDYTVPVGNAPSPHTGSAWGFPYSIETTGSLVLSDFTFLITITDVTKGLSATFDPTTPGDNVYCTGPVASCTAGTATSTKNLAIDTLLQNSQAVSFPQFSTPLNYNSYSPDAYTISLTATPVSPLTGSPATVDENIDAATPEPAAMGLMAAGLLGLVFAARRRQ